MKHFHSGANFEELLALRRRMGTIRQLCVVGLAAKESPPGPVFEGGTPGSRIRAVDGVNSIDAAHDISADGAKVGAFFAQQ